MKKLVDKIRNVIDFNKSDAEVFEFLSFISKDVFSRKLKMLEEDPTSLDLAVEKEHADKYLDTFKSAFMFEGFKLTKDDVRIKFFYKLYMILEDYEKLAILSKID